MKITGYLQPKSSFLSVEKDMELLINKIMANQRLQKYLYYTDKDPLSKPVLTTEQALELFEKNDLIDYIIVVITPEYRIKAEEIISKNNYKKLLKLVNGGETRKESSYFGSYTLVPYIQ